MDMDEAAENFERAVEEMEEAKLNLEKILGGNNGSNNDLL